MIDMRGIVTLGGAGLGAMAGVALAVPLLVAGVFFPGALAWAWVPVVVGTVGGAVAGFIME